MSHGRLAYCRPRAPHTALSPRGRGRCRGAWARDSAHSSHARATSGRSRPEADSRLARTGEVRSRAAVAADRAAGVVDPAAPGRSGRRSVSALVSAVRLRAGERRVGEGGRSRARERAGPRACAGHSGSARSTPAGGVAGSGRDGARVRGGNGERRRWRCCAIPVALLARRTGWALVGRAVQATDELLELLAPLLAANGNESGAAGENGTPRVDRGASASESGEAPARDRAEH